MKKMRLVIVILAVVLVGVFVVFAIMDRQNKNDGNNEPAATQTEIKTIDIALTDELYAFGVSKTDAALQKSVNEFIAQVKADGTLNSIIDKYYAGGEPTPVTSAVEDATKDQLIIATNAAFAPFEYMQGTNYVGIDMELAKLLADKLGQELVIKNVEFDSIPETVNAGYADIAIAGLTVNEKRTQFVTFSDPYFTASQKIIVPADDKSFDACKTSDDVVAVLNKLDKNTVIGAQNGTTGYAYIEGSEDFGFAGLPTGIKGYSSGSLAVQDMLNGNIKYVIIDEAPANYLVATYNAQK